MHKRLFYSTHTHTHARARARAHAHTILMSLLFEIDDYFSNVKVWMTTNDA